LQKSTAKETIFSKRKIQVHKIQYHKDDGQHNDDKILEILMIEFVEIEG